MHIAAVAWLNLAKGLSLSWSFLRALINPTGLRVSPTPLISASDSRRRDTAGMSVRDRGHHDDHQLAGLTPPAAH